MTVRVGIVIGEFHKAIAEQMLASIQKRAEELGVLIQNVIWVPGSYEAPLVIKKLLERDDIDGVVLTGYIEKGSTLHGEQMGLIVGRLAKELELTYEKPVGMGIIGPGATIEQAHQRISYGAHALAAVVRMCAVVRRVG